MKIALVSFYRSTADLNTAQAVKEKTEAFLPVDGCFSFRRDSEEDFSELFDKICHAYDSILVLKYSRNELKEAFPEDKVVKFAEEGKEIEAAEEFLSEIESKFGTRRGEAVFKTFGEEAETVVKAVAPIERDCGIKFVVSGEYCDLKVELVYDDKSSKMEFDNAQKRFLGLFGDAVYATEDMTLEETLVFLLKTRKKKMSAAESFTGGKIAASVVSISGASEVFYEGIVAYDELAKARRLGVKEESLRTYRPVSAQVAGEMARGLVIDGRADVAVSTTGIAGPNSDDSGFPVGLCYFGIAAGGEIKVYKRIFDGDRKSVIEKGTKTAMFLAIKAIKNL